MSRFSDEVKVGGLVLIAFITIIGFSLKISGISILDRSEYSMIYMDFQSASGISDSAVVSLSGVKIGKVNRIYLHDNKARIETRINKDTRIPKNSTAMIRTAGLLGESYIEIIPNTLEIDILKDGDLIDNTISSASISDLVNKVNTVLGDLTNVSSVLKTALGYSPDGSSRFAETLSNLNKASLRVADLIGKNVDRIGTGIDKFDQVFSDLQEVSKNLKQLSDIVSKGEGTVGKLIKEDAVYESLNSTLESANSIIERIEKSRLDLDIRYEHRSEGSDNRGHFGFKFFPREDKFYMFELTTDSRDPDYIAKKSKGFNKLLYSVMIGKRFSDFTLSAGLIESSVGGAASYHMFEDRLSLTGKVFNFRGYDNTVSNPQLGFQLRWDPYKYIYFYVGADELLNKKYRTYIGGVGVTFSDNDLKLGLGFL